jgi:hypothetical protein
MTNAAESIHDVFSLSFRCTASLRMLGWLGVFSLSATPGSP